MTAKGRHLGGGAGSGGNGTEFGLLPQGREGKGGDQRLKGGVRILIKRPHGLGRVDGRTAAHGDDPVGLEFLHYSGAAHDRFH